MVYLSWDKDFLALAKKSIQIITYIFSYFWKKTSVLGTLAEALLMNTHNICFLPEIRQMSIFRQVNLGWTWILTIYLSMDE